VIQIVIFSMMSISK